MFDCGGLKMCMFRIILTILSQFLSIVQPTIERNDHHCKLCYQIYFSVTALKVMLLTVTTLTFSNKQLLIETKGRGSFTIKAEMYFYIKAKLNNGNPNMLNKLRSLKGVTTFDLPKSHDSTNKQLITKFRT